MTDRILTPRQLDILELMVEGLSVPKIASRLGLTIDTVRMTKVAMYERLGVDNMASAVMVAYSRGLLRGEPS